MATPYTHTAPVGVQITMPKDNLHWGEAEHRDLHNLYGALFHQATTAVRILCPPSAI